MIINLKKVVDKKAPAVMKLLLLADPDPRVVASYLDQCTVLIAENAVASPIGVLAYQEIEEGQVELMNLAVLADYQGKGVGRRLIEYFLDLLAGECSGVTELIVKTGDLSYPALALYQQTGFQVQGIIQDYFVTHYEEPIYENGERLRNQVILSQVIPCK